LWSGAATASRPADGLEPLSYGCHGSTPATTLNAGATRTGEDLSGTHVDLIGGPGEASGVGNGHEVPDLSKIRVGPMNGTPDVLRNNKHGL
jgi:hypothetical protein